MATEYTYTPEEFDKRVRAYHAKVETEQNAFPDLAGLKNALRIEDEEYDDMVKDPEYHGTCLWAMRRRESFLNRAALTAKNTTGIKMLLAQPENGGYLEKPIDKGPRQIEVTLRGMSNDFDPDGDSDDSDGDEPDSVSDAVEEVRGAVKTADNSGRKRGRPKKST